MLIVTLQLESSDEDALYELLSDYLENDLFREDLEQYEHPNQGVYFVMIGCDIDSQ